MNPLDALSAVLATHNITQGQQEALIDLIVWTMYADGAIRHEENEQLDIVVARLDKASAYPLRSHLYTAIARIRDVWHDPTRAEGELDRLFTQLGDDAFRRAACAVCDSVARADGDLATAEQSFLQQVRRRFGIG